MCCPGTADAIPVLHGMLLASRHPYSTTCPELAALLISLAGSVRVAEELGRGGRLEQLLELALGPGAGAAAAAGAPEAAEAEMTESSAAAPPVTCGGVGAGDELLWRLLRTVAGHESEALRPRFGPALRCMASLLVVSAFVHMPSCVPNILSASPKSCSSAV